MNLNHVIIVGRMTKDPELRKTQAGQSVLSFSLATNRNWTDKEGVKKEETEFHNCVAWGKTAELINQYMTKGSELLVQGRLQTRDWEDKQGAKRKSTEIMVETMQFGAKPSGQRAAPSAERVADAESDAGLSLEESGGSGEPIKPEDLPF